MTSDLNYSDLSHYPMKDLRNEAAKLNINTPPRVSKPELIKILQDYKKEKSTFISNKLLGSSSEHSQRTSQNNSSRQSPTPKESYQSLKSYKNISPQPIYNENNIQNTFSSENTFQQAHPQEEREKSPLLPSSSSKNKPHSSHKKTPHTHDERKVHYNNADRHNHTSGSFSISEKYTVPRNLVVMNYISGGCAILFAIAGIISTPFVIVAIINALLFLYLHIKLNSILETKSQSLAPKVTSYLKDKCGGRGLRSDIKKHFNVDSPIMRRLTTLLEKKERIRIKNKENKDQEWVLLD